MSETLAEQSQWCPTCDGRGWLCSHCGPRWRWHHALDCGDSRDEPCPNPDCVGGRLIDPNFGDMATEFVPQREQIIDHLLSIICRAGEPWTGDDPTADHGHTHCMLVGAAIRELRR